MYMMVNSYNAMPTSYESYALLNVMMSANKLLRDMENITLSVAEWESRLQKCL